MNPEIRDCTECKYAKVEWDICSQHYGEPCNSCISGNPAETRNDHFEPADSDSDKDHKRLTINEYQQMALRTENGTVQIFPRIFNAALGLCGESGEVADLVKKWAFQGHPKDHEKVAEELGDICWYIAIAADALGLTLEEIMYRNIEKLKRRYPDGFETERSVNRNE